jgi:hypothetical protein
MVVKKRITRACASNKAMECQKYSFTHALTCCQLLLLLLPILSKVIHVPLLLIMLPRTPASPRPLPLCRARGLGIHQKVSLQLTGSRGGGGELQDVALQRRRWLYWLLLLLLLLVVMAVVMVIVCGSLQVVAAEVRGGGG